MASCNIVIGNPDVLKKIESFFNDTAYKEAIENSATFNTRLCIERRLRMPFLDSQTGVAQNHSNLFMTPRQRLPGLLEGQIYTYPARRWRKKRRQYLMNFVNHKRKDLDPDSDMHTISTIENPAALNEDSKDSLGLKDDTPKMSQDSWYYDDIDMQEMDGYDEPDMDSDYDYEESYSKRRKKRTPRGAAFSNSPAGRKPKGRGGRRKAVPEIISDADKPFACELCGVRYKTRPGLSYHQTHTHKDKERPPVVDETESSEGAIAGSDGAASPAPLAATQSPASVPVPPTPEKAANSSTSTWGQFQDSYLSFLQAPGGVRKPGKPSSIQSSNPNSLPASEETRSSDPDLDKKKILSEDELSSDVDDKREKGRAAPSLYCDFCLGDSTENKKTGQSEELVSCSDCGRSGHPTCLQFTQNMIISVRKYRWQCIECKCCSICGNSDNDDQLLFCDDCDRGYHMYCLTPPLSAPPEGSWSCKLCLEEFHKK